MTYASPNAVSAIHRLGHVGDVVGGSLAQIVTDVLRDESPVDESLALVVTGRAPWRTDVASRGASVSMRAIPLIEGGRRTGAILLLRDVSELRRRERDLLTKDATIREIHHRVKNNLQTVAALLRMQSRRLPDDEARAALDEAVRRVGTIAIVHETLSQGFDETVDFDEVIARELAARGGGGHAGRCRCAPAGEGTFGRLRAEDATSLAMIISELVHNAVEHGLARGGGTVEVAGRAAASRTASELLEVCVADDGRGAAGGLQPRPRAGWAPRSSPRWCRTCAGGSPGNGRSRAEPSCGSSRGSGRSRTSGRTGPPLVWVVRGVVRAAGCQPARRARALRRLRARRSSSESAPQTPAS